MTSHGKVWAAPVSSADVQVERTFAFVDLAGFTALTEAHGDAEAIATVRSFRARAEGVLAPGDEYVKSIGDAVMLTFPTPEAAVTALVRLVEHELVCTDARTYELPREDLVLFLYNPFVGEVLDDVATRVERSLAGSRGDLWLLYRNPQCADRVARIPGLVEHAASRSYRIYRRAS